MADEFEPLTDEQLVSLVNQEFEDALGAPGGDLSRERAEALDYYLQKLFGDEVEKQSKIVTSDVEDVVDGKMPSLLRIFTTADNVVSFDPVGPEDVEAAQQESDYVDYIFFKKNPSFEIMFFWFFDALVQKNGIVKCWWDESEEITTESYEGRPEDEILGLIADDDIDEDSIELSNPREIQTVDDNGNPITQFVQDLTFKRIKKVGRIHVENVPPDEYRISGDARSLDPSRARMVGHERELTRDELIAMGIDKSIVLQLPATDHLADTTEKQARRDKTDDQRAAEKSIDKSQDKILFREAYMKVDDDGDGRAELKRIWVAVGHDKPLLNEPFDRQPFHVICPSPIPHKHFGRSDGDKFKGQQRTTSELVRQIHNNLYQTNQPGSIISETHSTENTMDDLLTVSLGRNVRVRGDVNAAHKPIVVPFTAGESFPMLEYWERVKRTRSGVNDSGEGLTPEALKNIQQSVMAEANDLSRMKIEAVARIFAETGVKSLFLHIHELTLKHQQKKEIVELRNQWVPVDPREWKTRLNMTVNIGLGIGTRDRNLIHLNAIWDKQVQMVEGGGMNLTVTPQNLYQTAVEIVKNSRLSNPQLYFTDPGDKPAPPPADQQLELQRQQQEIVQRQQQLDAEKRRQDRAKIQLQAQEQRLEHQREMAEINRKREADADKLTVAMDQLRTQIAELELKYNTNLPEPTP